MRRIALWLAATVVALVLLLGYRTSTMGMQSAPPAVAAGPDPASAGPSGPAGTVGPARSTKVVDGGVARTRWGPVQVQAHLSGSKLVDVVVLQQPDGNQRDRQINSRALPKLRAEALKAQSADIDTVSGATYTSDGYRESLQAALDAAHTK
jgi:uncharacterized protein with FMN-binding domain